MNLAEIYIRAAFPGTERFDDLARELEAEVIGLAKDLYKKNVSVDFALQEGSLIEKAKVVGKSLAVAIGIVAGYHELRESVIDIYNDAGHFSEMATKQFRQMTHTPISAIEYKRTLPRDVVKLHRIIQNVDLLQQGGLPNAVSRSIRDKIVADIASLSLANPEDSGVEAVLNNLPRRQLPQLPESASQAVQVVERRRRGLDRPERLAEKELFPMVDKRAPPKRKLRRYHRITNL